MTDVLPEWDDYLQAFRLHQGLSRSANFEAQRLLKQANAKARAGKRVLPRAYGLLAFTIQSAWLSDWIDDGKAHEILREAVAEVEAVTAERSLPGRILVELNKVGGSIDAIVKGVNVAYADVSASLDGNDYDNLWSQATANLYAGKFEAAFVGYADAKDKATREGAADVCVGSIAADNADALFFAIGRDPDPSATKCRDAIQQAIDDTQAAIDANPHDPKRKWWNWTLGWAYYELGAYTDRRGELETCARSLMILQRFKRPHDLICKNLMASHVALGMIEPAEQLAREFIARNPNYRLAVEHRWPYRSTGDGGQLQRWKGHLRTAGLPD